MIKFTPILPGPFRASAFNTQVVRAVSFVTRDIKRDFQSTVSSWNHQVRFVDVPSASRDEVSRTIYTTDRIYGWVNNGTRNDGMGGYMIQPVNKKSLSYQKEFSSKTLPRTIGSRSGGKFGEKVFRAWTIHPGTEARKFDEAIAEKHLKRLVQYVQHAMTMGVRNSGHKF